MNGSRYKDAGVDIATGAALVKAIAPLARATARPGADADLGGFGGLFDLGRTGLRDPVLVAATDGVGTKLIVANAADMHDTVGIDLVAMCVNDLVVQGAEPLFFLDYFATGRLDIERATRVIAGIAAGCSEAGCALIGGETAEMPGMYNADDYDLAGFAVGAAERGDILTGAAIAPGDVILGLAASGLHANGFSLVRRIVADQALDYAADSPFGEGSLGAALLTPTRIYVRSCLAAHRKGLVRGFAHITGGGFIENVARILPDGAAADIDATAWPLPPVFGWLQRAGGIAPEEMASTFNCGIGMIVVTAPAQAAAATEALEEAGETVYRVGAIVDRTPQLPPVMISGMDTAWRG